MQSVMELPVWAQILLEEVPEASERRNESSRVMSKLKTCLVLIAHGSKDPRWREPFERLYLNLRASHGDSVKLAYMEFVEPSLLEIASECVRAGAEGIRVLPLFMAAGAHLATDIPEQVQRVREAHPDVRVEVLPAIGEDARMISLMQQIVCEQVEELRTKQQ